jgi:hypothetical protein
VKIKYREIKGWKYQLLETYEIQTTIRPPISLRTDWVILSMDGLLTIRAGYCWDGASGPTWDDKSNLRGSLPHDAIYQLIRLGMLPLVPNKAKADALLQKHCMEDGMSAPRAWAWLRALTLFGSRKTRAMSSDIPKVLEAP